MKKVSCIIPTYNEAPRIGDVLRIVEHHPLIDEIIVINDGSTDNTNYIVSSFKKIQCIEYAKNQGKSKAIGIGVKKAKNELIFLLDADLLGLKVEDITNLIEPVLLGKTDITISLRKNAPSIFKFLGIDYISGERVLPKNILADNLEKITSLPKFGLESFINKLIIKDKYKIKIIPWDDVNSPYKNVKRGFWIGVKDEILMVRDIFNTIGIFGPIFQIIKMSRLRVK